MILTAHQPVYLPWLGLFHKIALSDVFVSFNQVQYLIKDWNNRNRILTSNGPIWLTVPVFTTGYRDKKFTDIEINNNLSWQSKHWKSILFNYKKTKYFNNYSDYFEDVYLKKEWKFLSELNENMLIWFLNIIGIKIKLYKADQFCFVGSKSNLVLDMCKKLNAKTYIFGALGSEYADIDAFKDNGIAVYFQSYNHPKYEQMHKNFYPNMSIIDLLFNHGNNSYDIIMEGNVRKNDIVIV